MENYSVYEDIANRTGGDIYVGVVGPVRTGKSTFIKRFMETLVIPSAEENARAVMTDELPQSAAGKTVMTTEPKFVPAKAAKIQITKGAEVAVRLVDCVGFAVEGANGFEEDGSPRLVKTPWSETAMPFEQAAALGTEKVIQEHSTIGVMVTTDGSITDLPRNAYVAAEERTVSQLKTLKKPFVILLNCVDPSAATTLKNSLEEKYQAPVVAMNVENITEADILLLLQKALFEFPVTSIDVKIPKWLQTFDEENSTVAALLSTLKKTACGIAHMRDCFDLENLFEEDDDFCNPTEIKMDLGKGRVEITVGVKDSLFYQTLSNACGEEISDELSLMQYACSLSGIKKEYDKVKDALEEADKNGYGIVYPTENDYSLEKPQLVKKGAGYGVHFKANAASYHVVKVNVTGTVNSIIGTKQQSEEFVDGVMKTYEESADGVWETNIFGKSLRDLVGDELSSKSNAMPIELRRKMRRAVTRIVNEGKGNVICILF
ncbi:MAG: stage IV sporulation protein A [Clostridiales bacterium]|nr:stage IV sporulation protein A [Clostridiales bacterium]